MGFKEVAYKGLETGSKLIGAHVMQNGSITLEIINTLETIDDDNVLKFPFFQNDLNKFRNINHEYFLENFKLTTDDLAESKVCHLNQIILNLVNNFIIIL